MAQSVELLAVDCGSHHNPKVIALSPVWCPRSGLCGALYRALSMESA